MEAKLVDVHKKYIAPLDLRQWMEVSSNVYIGRRGVVFVKVDNGRVRWPPQDSIWANPYKVQSGPVATGYTRDEAIQLYRAYIMRKLDADPELRKKLLELRGKTLGCWCVGDNDCESITCHGQVLIELIDKYDDSM